MRNAKHPEEGCSRTLRNLQKMGVESPRWKGISQLSFSSARTVGLGRRAPSFRRLQGWGSQNVLIAYCEAATDSRQDDQGDG